MNDKKSTVCDCGGFVQDGTFVHAETCARSRIRMSASRLVEFLTSVEVLCAQARKQMHFGLRNAWEKDKDKLAAIADLLCDAKTDLEKVEAEIEARQIAAETP